MYLIIIKFSEKRYFYPGKITLSSKTHRYYGENTKDNANITETPSSIVRAKFYIQICSVFKHLTN